MLMDAIVSTVAASRSNIKLRRVAMTIALKAVTILNNFFSNTLPESHTKSWPVIIPKKKKQVTADRTSFIYF